MADPALHLDDKTQPLANCAAVTPSDSADLPTTSRALYVGVSGNVVVELAGMGVGSTVTLVGLAAGIWHPMRVRKVWAASTTATSIVAGW